MRKFIGYILKDSDGRYVQTAVVENSYGIIIAGSRAASDAHVFATYEEARAIKKDPNWTWKILRYYRRPGWVIRRKARKVDTTIKGWIVRKRHPHVFATKAEAMACAGHFPKDQAYKVVPVRAGHEALGT